MRRREDASRRRRGALDSTLARHRRAHKKFKLTFDADSYTFVDLLPQVRPEDLDQRDLQRRNLPVHEDARQIQLDLEACVSMA